MTKLDYEPKPPRRPTLGDKMVVAGLLILLLAVCFVLLNTRSLFVR